MLIHDSSYTRQIIDRQRRLSEILGVSGHEEKVTATIAQEIEGVVDKFWVDNLGNLLAVMFATGENTRDLPAILLDAHADEIGFIVIHVTEQGFAYFTLVGGWDERLFLGQHAIVEVTDQRLSGVVGALPPHITSAEERAKPIPFENLFLDFGFLSREEANQCGLQVGTVGTLDMGFHELTGGRLQGKAFDDRSGCNVLVQTALNLTNQERPNTLCFLWSVQEELGSRGARTAAYSLDREYHVGVAIAVENTTAGDVPGVQPPLCPSRMGKGPAITLMDANTIVSPRVNERLIAIAEANAIPYQFKTPARGGTDAGAIHLTRAGIPSGIISVPGRYIHSPGTIIDLQDLLGAIDLVTLFASKEWNVTENQTPV